MPPTEPLESETPERGPLRANLLPALGVGAIMGFLAQHEGSGLRVALVVGIIGCAVVLGMLALKKFLSRSS